MPGDGHSYLRPGAVDRKPILTASPARCSASSLFRRDRRWKDSTIWRRGTRSSSCSRSTDRRRRNKNPSAALSSSAFSSKSTGTLPVSAKIVRHQFASIEPGNQPRRATAVGIVLAGELCTQQPLFGTNAREKRRNEQHCEQYPDPRTKSECPPQRVDEQAQIARVTDDTVDTTRNQRVAGLDGYQTAETAPEHKDRPDPLRAPGGEQNDAKPANGISVEDPEPFPICVGRQISGQHPDQPESYNNPTVGTILAHAGAKISVTEERDARQGEEYDCKSDQGGVGEEGSKPPQPRMARPR